MQSFRTELELVNHSTKALVEKDIIELDRKIREYRDGKITDEKFRSLRLTRGVYGQRQKGVQMIRIKLPFGKISTKQLVRIADISDEYSNGNLHLTTRQDIQIHHVSLDKTPELWAKLEQDEITLREACGNTVRNITASAEAGIDPAEPFDVSPYAEELFRYFLRKPFAQELGRKIKIAFSNSEKDSAYTFIHDFGFIPRIRNGREKGFKVLVGGGLGAQPFLAQTAFEFLPEDLLIPFTEAAIRVFDRYGERTNRNKARLKYLISKTGLEEFLSLVEKEKIALTNQSHKIETGPEKIPGKKNFEILGIEDTEYALWLRTNTFRQKQNGFHGVYVKIQLGNIHSGKARELAAIAEKYSDAADLRITVSQNLLLKYVPERALPHLYLALKEADLAQTGYNSVADITACPGTDTCNLAISNSTAVSLELEKIVRDEYYELLEEQNIKIKISGCMNSCGQHGIANIGFHGSSFKVGNNVIPALQLLLGGGFNGRGNSRQADKVIKIASKRAPDALRLLLNDFENNSRQDEYFNDYYERHGKDYFYQLLKPLADNNSLKPWEFTDWGSDQTFETAIGVGECAGVVIDLVQTLLLEAEEKLQLSREALTEERFADSIYHSYAAFINGAKAILLDNGSHVNTHHGLIKDFNAQFIQTGKISLDKNFSDLVLQINLNEPSNEFAALYLKEAVVFLEKLVDYKSTAFANKELIQA